MFKNILIASFLVSLPAFAGEGEINPGQQNPAQQGNPQIVSVDQTIAAWPVKVKEAAAAAIAKYGQPDEFTASHLLWFGKGIWHKTMIMRDEIAHAFPMAHTDFLTQAIFYKVPVDKIDDLAALDGSITVYRTAGVLSATCDKEEFNILALNLAYDVISDKRTVEDARAFLAQTVKQFMAGEKPEYTQKLLFEPMEQAQAQDQDVAVEE